MMSESLKGFLIGVTASLTAVVVWDLVKHRYGLLKEDVEKEL